MSKDTMRELELQVETQRQTLVSRDESIKKLLDMLQSKGARLENKKNLHLKMKFYFLKRFNSLWCCSR